MRRFADSMSWEADQGGFAINSALNERLGFIRKTYLHLGVELMAVAGVTALCLQIPAMQRLAIALISNFIIYIGVFFGVSLISRKLMEGTKSIGVQYAGAALWVFFLGLLITPLAMIAHAKFGNYSVLFEAFVMTACVFGGLTAYVFFTKKDFSFMRGALVVVSWTMVGFALISFLFGGFGGSPIWSMIWVVLLGGWVLYDTSNVLHHRRVDQHVAASVDLLVDFVYMFIHILSLLMNRD
ncbi:MAG: Bax inhibitor-1/YccA family protein [Planctomycetota bacterium]|jgi:FtsH-binding integral membrane protein